MCQWRIPGQLRTKLLLAVALHLLLVAPELDGRFLKIQSQPPGTVGIVPSDEDGERMHFVPLAAESDHPKANEMISVKLLNQFRTRSFMPVEEEARGISPETVPAEERTAGLGPDYQTVNLPASHGQTVSVEPHVVPAPAEPVHIDVKENIIEDDFLPVDPMVNGRPPAETHRQPEKPPATPKANDGPVRGAKVAVVGMAPAGIANRSLLSTTLTTTTTRTTTSTTTIRKVRRKSIVTSSKPASSTPTSTTQRARPTASATSAPRGTTTGRSPAAPRIDITRLNLEHLENELVSFPNLGTPQALPAPARLLPRSIRSQGGAQPPADVPTCGCQHRKRSLAPAHLQSSEESADFGGDYDDYDYGFNDVRRNAVPYAPKVPDGQLLFPVMSRLLAPASSEASEGSVERAEMVHGTLERLMGIVTIFSHVDEFIQRKTKQSIRRLARLYESEEMY